MKGQFFTLEMNSIPLFNFLFSSLHTFDKRKSLSRCLWDVWLKEIGMMMMICCAKKNFFLNPFQE